MPEATIHQGTSERSNRCPAARSSVGPRHEPGHAGERRRRPARRPRRRRGRWPAPRAGGDVRWRRWTASIPSWRRRRWATTTKPAAATRQTRIETTTARPSAPTAATVRSSSPRSSTMRTAAGSCRRRPSSVVLHQHGQLVAHAGSPGATSANSSSMSARVLDDADHGPVHAVEVDVVADGDPEGGRGAVGDRDLVTPGVAARTAAPSIEPA